MFNDNLLNDVKEGVELTSGMLVGSTLIKKMEIYGFIPYLEKRNLSFEVIENHKLLNMRYETIASDRIVFAVQQRTGLTNKTLYVIHPIVKRIKKNGNNRLIPLENLYLISMWQIPYYQYIRNKKSVLHNAKGLQKQFPEQICIDEEKSTIDYLAKSSDFLMYRKLADEEDKVSAVASYFLVVCRFINPVTGEISYAVYNPEDLALLSEQPQVIVISREAKSPLFDEPTL